MLPIQKVVLFQHGVGYFERHGRVDGEAKVELAFQAAEMNDVLKSLTALDLDGGHIANIAYDSTQPLSKQLERVRLRLPEDQAMTGLLAQLQGARVTVQTGGEPLRGTVMGIERAERTDGDRLITVPLLTLLLDGAAMRTVDLREVRSVELADEHLQGDLQRLLEVLVASKREDLKRITIVANGKGQRRLHVSYVVEAPVWKTSYRVLLPSADEPKNKPLLQGWALVDNTQEEDWENVELALVAGLPVSFVHDLYTARYRRRPVVEVEDQEAYAPPQMEQAYASAAAEGVESFDADDEMLGEAMAAAPRAAGFRRGRSAKKLRSEARRQSNPVQTRTSEVSDLFQYLVDHPVTVRRGESALVPILQSDFDGRRVLVYNQEIREGNPMSAVRMHNTTGMTLEGGPMTVLEDEDYVGEAMLETLKPDDEQLVPYSVELGCLVTVDHHSDTTDVHRLRVVDGHLHLIRYYLKKTIYLLNNKLDRKFDVYLDHRFQHGWDLFDTPDPSETTENFYRFRFPMEAKRQQKFEVIERGEQTETISLTSGDPDRILVFMQGRKIEEPIRQSLQNLARLNGELAQLQRDIEERDANIQEIFEDQQRLRENLGAIGSTEDERELRQRWVAAFGATEDRIRVLREERDAFELQRQATLESLHAMLGSLELDVKV